jgi:hypothetical protein
MLLVYWCYRESFDHGLSSGHLLSLSLAQTIFQGMWNALSNMLMIPSIFQIPPANSVSGNGSTSAIGQVTGNIFRHVSGSVFSCGIGSNLGRIIGSFQSAYRYVLWSVLCTSSYCQNFVFKYLRCINCFSYLFSHVRVSHFLDWMEEKMSVLIQIDFSFSLSGDCFCFA